MPEIDQQYTNRITTLGIPTRDRTASLARCIRSYLTQIKHADRRVDVCIVDNSTDPEIAKANRSMLQTIADEEGISLRYLDRSLRARWAAEMAKQLGIPEGVTRFALLGDDRCPDSYGACRNTLLLDAAGKLTIQTDDDTVCCIGASPSREKGLKLSARDDPNTYQYFLTQEEALGSVQPLDENVFSLHEALLGRPTIDVLGETLQAGLQPDIRYASAGLASRLAHPESTVVSTFLGIVGDSGMHGHAFRLFQEGDALESMLESEALYQRHLTTRWIQKTVPQTTLSNGSFCMTIHIGLDARRILPPFMPVMRNEDGVFGSVRTTCFPSCFSGYLPYVVQHLPPQKRSIPSLVKAAQSPGMRTNDLISQLVLYARPSSGEALSLDDVGIFLCDLGALSAAKFEQHLRKTVNSTRENLIAYAEQCLDRNLDAPSFWRKDISRYINSLRRASKDPTRGLPADLHGSANDRLFLFQDLVDQFGKLLRCWQHFFEASKHIPMQGLQLYT